MKPQSVSEQQEIKCQYIYFWLASCCFLLARESYLFWKFLGSLALCCFSRKQCCQRDVAAVPQSDACGWASPKTGLPGEEGTQQHQRSLKGSRCSPKIPKKILQVSKKLGQNYFLDHVCVYEYPCSHFEEQHCPEKLSFFWENSSFFRVEVYQKAAPIPELCTHPFFFTLFEAAFFENPSHSYRNIWNTLQNSVQRLSLTFTIDLTTWIFCCFSQKEIVDWAKIKWKWWKRREGVKRANR